MMNNGLPDDILQQMMGVFSNHPAIRRVILFGVTRNANTANRVRY